MKKNNTTKVIPLLKQSYLAMIKNTLGSNMFRTFYAKVNGKKKDITNNGDLSCAFFVSSVLTIFGLIKKIHGTVDGAVKDLVDSGWIQINRPKIGSIVVWEKKIANGEEHKHIGFYVGNNLAISNSSKKKAPALHNLTYNGKRRVTNFFWQEKLN